MSKYCSNCGLELPDDAVFCSQCGKKETTQESKSEQKKCDQTTEYKVQNNNYYGKEDLLSGLERAQIYFQEKQFAYNAIDNLVISKNNLKKPNGFALFILGVILAFVLYIIIAVNFPELDISVLINVLFFGFFIAFPIILFIKGYVKVKNQIVLINQQLNTIETELQTHFNAYPNSPVSLEYSNPKIIDVLKHNIASGRADNMKESINCMLDDFHKQQTLLKQDEIARNSKNAANAASTAALFSAGVFLNTRK